MRDSTDSAQMKPDIDRIERDLRHLLSVPSVSGDEYAAQDVVAALLDAADIGVERLDVPLGDVVDGPDFPGVEMEHTSFPIVIGRIRGSRPGPTLMLQGHVDVVPPGSATTWTSPPFEPDLRDGNLYGRGACDMKAGVVANLEAVRAMVGVDFAGEIIFLAVPAEEDGGAGAYAAIRHGITADACVVTEPTNLDIVIAHGGAITFTLGVPGKAAHASMRREGVSALDNLTYLVDALRQDEASRNASESHPLMAALGLPYPTIIGQVEGGNWTSTVMDHVKAHGRYGVRLGQDCDGAALDLRRAVFGAAAEHEFLADNPPALTVWGGRFESSSVPMNHPLPVGLQDASTQAGHGRPALTGAPYGADMRLHINQGRTPTVMYGPGDAAVAHSADEFVPLAQVLECVEVLVNWLSTTLV